MFMVDLALHGDIRHVYQATGRAARLQVWLGAKCLQQASKHIARNIWSSTTELFAEDAQSAAAGYCCHVEVHSSTAYAFAINCLAHRFSCKTCRVTK